MCAETTSVSFRLLFVLACILFSGLMAFVSFAPHWDDSAVRSEWLPAGPAKERTHGLFLRVQLKVRELRLNEGNLEKQH